MFAFLLALLLLEVLVAVQLLYANAHDILTVPQMLQSAFYRSDNRRGLPFWEHWGMRSDLFMLSPLVAGIFAVCAGGWRLGEAVLVSAISLLVSILMHREWRKIPWRETHVTGKGALTPVADVHVLYMSLAIEVLALYYIRTPYTLWMWGVAALVTAHVLVGSHLVPLGVRKWRRPQAYWWYPGHPLQEVAGWIAVSAVAIGTFGVTALRAAQVW